MESIQKPEETIYNLRLFMKIIRTIWKLIIMTLWPVSIYIYVTVFSYSPRAVNQAVVI